MLNLTLMGTYTVFLLTLRTLLQLELWNELEGNRKPWPRISKTPNKFALPSLPHSEIGIMKLFFLYFTVYLKK